MELAQEKHRNRVRPVHGEIWIVKGDSHSTHKALSNYYGEAGMHTQLSPAYVHEGVGPAELVVMMDVPSAMGLLMGTDDLGEEHFYAALLTATSARADVLSDKRSPARSNNQVYYQSDAYTSRHRRAFGSAVKALIHPEEQGAGRKFELHARACIYVGPAHDSDSTLHCAVWTGGRYIDIDCGCMSANDDEVIARMSRSHPSHQPFGQPRQDQSHALQDDQEEPHPSAPQLAPWTICSDPIEGLFSLGIASGGARPGDLTSYIQLLSGGRLKHLRIDRVVGGYEHDYMTKDEVLNGLVELAQRSNCVGAHFALECARWCASRHQQPGPPVLFNEQHPDGVPASDGSMQPEVQRGLREAHVLVTIGEALLASGGHKWLIAEFPSSHGHGSTFDNAGAIPHTTIADTTAVLAFTQARGLKLIHSDRGKSGSMTRKPTTHLVNDAAEKAMRAELGVLMCAPNEISTKLAGVDEQGKYITKASAAYEPLYCRRLAKAIVASTSQLQDATGGVGDIPLLQQADTSSNDGETPIVYPVGTRVDVYWEKDPSTNAKYGSWYSGQVTDLGVESKQIKGKKLKVRTYYIQYDDGPTIFCHSSHNTAMRLCIERNSRTATMAIMPQQCPSDVADAELERELNSQADTGQPTELVCPIAHRVARDEFLAACRRHTGGNRRGDESPILSHAVSRGVDGMSKDEVESYLESATVIDIVDTDGVSAALEAMRAKVMLMHEPTVEAGFDATALQSEVGPTLLHQELYDFETMLPCGDSIFLAWKTDGRVFVITDPTQTLNTEYAHRWHSPRNEREFNKSPQKALWQTAKELKMDQYKELHMYELVPRKSVDLKKYIIYETMWAYKIKLDSARKFDKLNPRWCFKGTNMDRDLYKSFSEMARMSSFKIILAIKGTYYKQLCAYYSDEKDAFQSTPAENEKGTLPECYCKQAPGFEEYGPNGEKLVCRVLVGMQGRIDATKLFNDRKRDILIDAGFTPCLWDPKCFIYNQTELQGTDASLTEIIANASARPGDDYQGKPYGWAMTVVHVDDAISLATGAQHYKDNRIAQHVDAAVRKYYGTKMSGWARHVGFTLTLNDDDETVEVSAPDVLATLADEMLHGQVRTSPKHIMTPSFARIELAEEPPLGDPTRDQFIRDQALTRHAIGVCIWLANAYPQLTTAMGRLTSTTHSPSVGGEYSTLAGIRHVISHLASHACGQRFGGKDRVVLEQPDELTHPYGCTPTARGETANIPTDAQLASRHAPNWYHHFSDANLSEPKSYTGGVACLGGAAISARMTSQHLASPNSHNSEVVASGTNYDDAVAVGGLLQELGIRQGKSTPFYIDSISTKAVAEQDSAIKKSVWLRRRALVLQEGVELDDITIYHIHESCMVADPFTKYLTYHVWRRHVEYALGRPIEPLDVRTLVRA